MSIISARDPPVGEAHAPCKDNWEFEALVGRLGQAPIRCAFSMLIWNFSLDEFGQQRERFLPAEIARLDGDGRGQPFLGDV